MPKFSELVESKSFKLEQSAYVQMTHLFLELKEARVGEGDVTQRYAIFHHIQQTHRKISRIFGGALFVFLSFSWAHVRSVGVDHCPLSSISTAERLEFS